MKRTLLWEDGKRSSVSAFLTSACNANTKDIGSRFVLLKKGMRNIEEGKNRNLITRTKLGKFLEKIILLLKIKMG